MNSKNKESKKKARLETFRNKILNGKNPKVSDHSSPSLFEDQYSWYDIEELDYGKTKRTYDNITGEVYVTRIYTGPGSIYLLPWRETMKKGSVVSDDY